jgi:hypothetical protein
MIAGITSISSTESKVIGPTSATSDDEAVLHIVLNVADVTRPASTSACE